MTIFDRALWEEALSRAFHTFWQTFAAILSLVVGTELIPAVGIEGVSWGAALSGATVAALLSVAKTLGAAEAREDVKARRAREE